MASPRQDIPGRPDLSNKSLTLSLSLEAERDKRRDEERGAILREQQELDEMRSLLRSGHGARLWEECEAPDGTPFWYNSQTGESTWDEPADLDAVVAASRPPTAGSRASGAPPRLRSARSRVRARRWTRRPSCSRA